MKKKKIVYTWGVWDLLHVGHIRLLQEAKALGDILIVGVFSDNIAKSFKRKPIIPFNQRVEMLKALSVGCDVIMQDELSPENNIRDHGPDIVAKGPGADWELMYKEIGKRNKVKTILLKYHKGVSTSNIIKKCRES